jgi:hypothetical protein
MLLQPIARPGVADVNTARAAVPPDIEKNFLA